MFVCAGWPVCELEYGAGRARALVVDALGAARTARVGLAAEDPRAAALERAAGHLDDARRELVDALRRD